MLDRNKHYYKAVDTMKPSVGGGSKYGDRMPSSSNKRGGGTFVQNKHVGRGGYNRSVISSRVQSTPSIQNPLESLQNVGNTTRNMPIENEDIHAPEKDIHGTSQPQPTSKSRLKNQMLRHKQIQSGRVLSATHTRANIESCTQQTHVEEQDDNVENSLSHDLHNTTGAQKKTTRGVTRCLDLLTMDRRKLLIVDVNDFGQPVGSNARKLASYLGTIARNPQKAPLTWDDWRKMPVEYKNHMWDLVKEKFEVDDALYIWVMKSLGNKWKNFKCSLKKKYLDAVIAGEDVLTISDPRVDPTQWKELLNFWRYEKCQERSVINKLNREKQIVGHTTGSKSFAMIREEIRQQRDDEKNPSRAELFTLTHTRKDGRPVNEESARVMSILQESSSPEENTSHMTMKDDLLSQVLGNDKPGRIRMLGLGPTPSSIYGPVPTRAQALQMVNQIKTSSEAVISKMFEKIEEMKVEHEKMKETYENRLGTLHAEVDTLKDLMQQNNENCQTHEDNASPSICSSASSHEIRRNVNRAPIQGSHDKFSKRNTQLHSEVQQRSKKKGRNDDNLNAQGKPMVYLKSFKKSLVNVARATVESRDPLKKVGGCDLGYEYWEVAIHVALLHNEPLPRPYGQFKTIGDAIGATIAWPFTFVTRAEE